MMEFRELFELAERVFVPEGKDCVVTVQFEFA
jgi:hypothetical protein